jgi:predicted GIY-YIG superfamily endonuclease
MAEFYKVYLLRCSDHSIYTGCTSNLEKRLEAHRNGKVNYTKDKLPFELVTYIAFTDKTKAFQFEKYLKSGSGKAFANKRFI